jgi:myo-inositol-1(or 4)-monophosphatase
MTASASLVAATDPGELVELARTIAGEVAVELVLARRERSLERTTKSSLTDVVTEMDLWVERRITERILAARPGDAIVGEEGTAHPGTSGVSWTIDPIDGTTNYLFGHPGYSVSIAAAVDGVPTVGVVVDPELGDEFAAVRGRGATRNGIVIAVSNADELALALVATGFSYRAERRADQAAQLAHVLPAVRDIRRMGSAALDLCSVACGRVDAYYERGLNPWDVAAGAIIAREAGAVVSDLDGIDLESATPAAIAPGTSVVAAGPALHGALLGLLRAAGA